MSSDLFSQITYQLDSDFFAHIPIHHDSDKLIAQVKQLLQHAICIDHKKILSDETCGIFKIQTPQEAIAIFASDAIPTATLFPKIQFLNQYENYGYRDDYEDEDHSDEIEQQKWEEALEAEANEKADIEYEINEHRKNDGPDPTFDGTYQFGSDDPPEEEDDDGYVDDYDGESDSEDEDQDQDQDDYSQEEDE